MTKKHSDAEALQSEKKVKELEKTKTEKVLLESEEQYRSLVESSDDPIYLVDRKLNYLYANKKLLSRYGKSLNEVTGQNYAKFHSPEATKLFSERIKKVFKSGKPFAYEYKSQRDEGNFLRTLSPIINPDTKKITAITIISKDITEQKRAEEALSYERDLLQALMDNIPDTIYFKDTASRFTRINKAQAQVLGVSDPKKATGKTDFDFFTEEHAQDAYTDEQKIVKTGKTLIAKVEKIKRANGQFRWVSCTKVPIKDEKGRVTGMVGISRDITDRKRAEERINHLNRILLAIRNVNQLITREKDRDSLIKKACSLLIETRGYLEVWTAILDEKGKIVKYAKAGEGKYILKISEILKSGKIPQCGLEALKQSKITITKPGQSTCSGCPVFNYDIDKGVLSIPLKYENKIYGVAAATVPAELLTDEEEQSLFAEVTGDIAFALWKMETEEEKHKLEEIESSILHSVPFAVIGLHERQITFANESVKDVFGWEAEELIGKNTRILYRSDEEYEKIADHFYPALEKQQTYYEEFPCRRKDGKDIICMVSTSIIGERLKEREIVATFVDITERKLAEEALREAEERFRTIFENMTIGIFRTTPDGRILMANPALIRMLGYSSFDELAMRNLEDAGYEPELPRSIFKKRIESEGKIIGLESAWKRRDGTTLFIRESGKVTRDDAGNTLYYEGTVEDITERKQAEEELKESEESYRGLFDNATDAIYIQDKDGFFVDVNEGAVKMYGYPREFFIGKTPAFLSAPGKNDMKKVLKMVQKAFMGEPQLFEFYGLRKNGEVFPKDVQLNSGTYFGKKVVIAFARDITERKRAEELLREREQFFSGTLNDMHTLVGVLEPDGRVIFVNDTALKVAGIKLEDVIGKRFYDAYWFRYSEKAKQTIREDINACSAGKTLTRQIKIQNANGELIWIEFSIHPIYDKDGKVKYLVPEGRDITDRKQAEMKLRRVHKIYCDAIENIEGIPYQLNYIDGKYEFVGESCEEIIGIPAGELTLKKLNEIVKKVIPTNPNVSQSPSDYGKAFFRGEIEKYQADLQIVTPAGKEKWISDCSIPLNDEKTGKVVGSLGIMQDISERKQAEEMIKALTNQIEQFSKISADILSIEDDRELFIKISSAIVEISDFSRVMFYTFKEDFPHRDILGYHGLDKKTIERLKKVGVSKEELGTIFKKGIPLGNQSCYIPHAMKDILDQKAVNNGKKEYAPGKGRWHREDNLFIALKDEAGDFIGMISVDDSKSGLIPTDETVKPLEMFANHISQILQSRKLEKKIRDSEEQYRLLVENVNDAIVISQHDKFIFFNKQFATMLGYKYDELLMKDYTEVYTEKAVEILMERQRIRNRGTEASSRYETVFKKKDGKTIDVEANVSIIEYRGDRATFAVIRDITERKRIEKEARRNQNLESIGILAGGIAHDFNNILTIILGNITLSKMYAKPEDKVYKRLVEAEKGAMRAKDLTQQLLTFSKGGAPVKETASIAEFLKESASFALSGSNVKCIFSIPEDIWAVEIDKGQINQVFNNLVINADQAMPEGGILKVNAENITITSADILPLQKGKYVKFSFEDHGIGISSHYLDKIFDPYFSTKTKGSGLGLASAYSVIRNHNGLITVESELGVGTTFYIYLPASEEIIVKKKAETGEALFGKGKILIMDDEDFIREVAGEMVESLGYSAEFASDGAEAIELYGKALKSEEPFAAVIMDLTIPGGMGGKEAVRELLKIDPEVKAIVSSGYSSDPIMSDCKKYGFVGVVAKPYKISELGKTLKEIILK